jgi:hypothetical protein
MDCLLQLQNPLINEYNFISNIVKIVPAYSINRLKIFSRHMFVSAVRAREI